MDEPELVIGRMSTVLMLNAEVQSAAVADYVNHCERCEHTECARKPAVRSTFSKYC